MDPKSYPPQKSEVTYALPSIYVSSQGPISIDVPGAEPEPVEEVIESPETTEPAEAPQEDGELGWGAEEPVDGSETEQNSENTEDSNQPDETESEETETEDEQ